VEDIMNGFSRGGILGGRIEGSIKTNVSPGRILVGQEQFDSLGAESIRDIYGNKGAEIIVVSDEKLQSMSASERMAILNR
jgi:hypothetical protein